jgi:hypothetical protein
MTSAGQPGTTGASLRPWKGKKAACDFAVKKSEEGHRIGIHDTGSAWLVSYASGLMPCTRVFEYEREGGE